MTFDELVAEVDRLLPEGHRVRAVPDRTYIAVFSGKTWLGNLHPAPKGVKVQPAYCPWSTPAEFVAEGLCSLLKP